MSIGRTAGRTFWGLALVNAFYKESYERVWKVGTIRKVRQPRFRVDDRYRLADSIVDLLDQPFEYKFRIPHEIANVHIRRFVFMSHRQRSGCESPKQHH